MPPESKELLLAADLLGLPRDLSRCMQCTDERIGYSYRAGVTQPVRFELRGKMGYYTFLRVQIFPQLLADWANIIVTPTKNGNPRTITEIKPDVEQGKGVQVQPTDWDILIRDEELAGCIIDVAPGATVDVIVTITGRQFPIRPDLEVHLR